MGIHAEDLRRYLSEASGRPVRLRMNDNAHSLITASRDGAGPGVRVSLHRIFLEADAEVLEALSRFIVKPDPKSRRLIREFISVNSSNIAQAVALRPRRMTKGSSSGQHFNLEERAAELNRQFFNSDLRFGIVWGRGTRGARHQSHVTLGTWNDRQRLIRIHPMLDHPHVPPYFLDFVIFHEMVHVLVPSRVDSAGRLCYHTREFRERERTYPRYAEAMAWEKRWLPSLIRAWHTGNGLPAKAAKEI